MERIDRVAEAADLAHLLEQPRRHAAAEHVGEDLQAVESTDRAAARPRARARYAPARDRAARSATPPRNVPAPARRGRRRAKRREAPLDLGDDRRVIDRAGGRDHHVGRAVVARQIAAQPLARRTSAPSRGVPRIERPTGWSGKAVACRYSKTRSSGVSSMAPISCTMTFFSRASSSGSKAGSVRMSDRTSSASGTSALQHARVVGGGLDAGRGVEVAADRLDLLGDLPRACAAPCP